jgi:hypothetical protein
MNRPEKVRVKMPTLLGERSSIEVSGPPSWPPRRCVYELVREKGWLPESRLAEIMTP